MIYTCLSLSPPYGSLIALLLKKIETRGWATSHRGPLLIHQTAAPGPRGTTEAALWDLCLSEPFRSALPLRSPATLPRGKIVALVELVDCVPTAGVRVNGGGPKYADWVHELSDQERAFGDYTPGRYGWILDKVRPLPVPIPARGMPGLWRWEGDLGL
jgi:activating signal cointegrator 1